MAKIKIVFTGGGTAGHILPILAIKKELEKLDKNQNLNFYYIGPKDNYINKIFSGENIKIKTIITGKIRRYFSILNIVDFFKFPIAFLQAMFYLFFISPDLVFSKGGYGSFFAALSARILHIPLFLHESDVVPGLANLIESKWALEVFTSFEKTEKISPSKIIWVGNPIRKDLLKIPKEGTQKVFGFEKERPLILILGGSQGSEKINNTILNIVEELSNEFEVLHQTGNLHFKKVKAEIEIVLSKDQKKHYHIYPFLDEKQMAEALFVCDLVLSRAGSGAIFEITAFGKPSILIPLANSAQNHQLKNALEVFRAGAAELVAEENLKSHFLLEKIRHLIYNPALLEVMKKNALEFAKPEAGKIIASYIFEYLSFNF
ncbi:MAG: undecaprenyldiphospho-muramoylpentapeptide beta-N-acetylglucosaminyltransferase [Minisyncoccia bacterium]